MTSGTGGHSVLDLMCDKHTVVRFWIRVVIIQKLIGKTTGEIPIFLMLFEKGVNILISLNKTFVTCLSFVS